MEEAQKNLGGWSEYITNFLEPGDVNTEEEVFLCVGVTEVDREEKKQLRLILIKPEANNPEDKYDFDLNKTNTVFIKKAGIESPTKIEGKKLYFRKTMAYSPSAKVELESLRINKID